MIRRDDDFDKEEEELQNNRKQINKKKILLIILPAIIIIGLIVSFYAVFNHKEKEIKNYNIVTNNDPESGGEKTTVYYDLPEIITVLKSKKDTPISARMRVSLESESLSEDKISILDGMSSKIQDVIISHLVELYPEEITNSEGMFWLKEELLYRINLIVSPLNIDKINIKQFEIQKEQQQG